MSELVYTERRQRPCRRSSVEYLRAAGALACAAQLCLGACYEYAAPHLPVIGAPVELTLTDSGKAALAPLIGTSPARLQGRLAADSAGMYLLRVDRIVRIDGSEAVRGGEQMMIPHELVATTGTRRLSPRRTFVTGAIMGAAIGTIAEVLTQRRGTSSGKPPGGKPTPQ